VQEPGIHSHLCLLELDSASSCAVEWNEVMPNIFYAAEPNKVLQDLTEAVRVAAPCSIKLNEAVLNHSLKRNEAVLSHGLRLNNYLFRAQ